MNMRLLCAMLHPLIIKLMKSSHKQSVQLLNNAPKVTGKAIYVANHSCCHDIPIAMSVIKAHTYLLAGKQSLYLTDRLGFILNGVIWVDREKKTSKNTAYLKMKHILNKTNLLIFPGGTWNLEESLPMLPMYWGVIQLAKETGIPIIPFVEEYRSNNCCYVKWGIPISIPAESDKAAEIQHLRDVMATLRWEIWEKFPVKKREEIKNNEWKKEKRRRLLAYPKLNWEYEKRFIRKE